MTATISLELALQRVLAAPCAPLPVEEVSLHECLGRTLAAEVAADGPWPSTDRSAMDGFALRAGSAGLAAGSVLPVVGESLAGHPYAGRLEAGQAVRIMTGAVLPAGADAVLPVERTSGFGGPAVTLHEAVREGANVRRQGSEVRPGQVLLRAGTRIRAAEVGALAVLGRVRVPVFHRPVVAIVATGDEVVPAERMPLPHQVRESNSWALQAQVTEAGGEPLRLGIAPDAAGPLRDLLRAGLDRADLLLTIGGVSAGTHDLVHRSLGELGVQPQFHGIALKPGKPTLFGLCAGFRAGFVFGLPGNPASSFTVFDLLVAPLLLRMLGGRPGVARPRAHLRGAAGFKPNPRLQAAPARLCRSEGGALLAELLPPSPSGDPFALLAADGYALLPPGTAPGADALCEVVPSTAGMRLQ